MKNLLFIGDSHLVALVLAAKELAGQSQGQIDDDYEKLSGVFQNYSVHLPNGDHLIFVMPGAGASTLIVPNATGGSSISPLYMEQFQAAVKQFNGPITQVYSYFFGNEHSAFAMVEHPVPLDFFIDRDDAGVTPGDAPRQVIPLEVVKRHLAATSMRIVIYCQVLRQIFPSLPVTHLLPPPPIGEPAQILGNPEIFGAMLDTYGLAPAALRKKAYALYCEDLTQKLAQIGVPVIGVPPGTADDGLLNEPYWKRATHGNHHYGQRLLEHMEIV